LFPTYHSKYTNWCSLQNNDFACPRPPSWQSCKNGPPTCTNQPTPAPAPPRPGTTTSFFLNLTFAGSTTFNQTRFRKNLLEFAGTLETKWNAAIGTPREPSPVLTVTASSQGTGNAAVQLSIVAERTGISAVWASLNITAAGNASFQEACVHAVQALKGDCGLSNLTRPTDVLVDDTTCPVCCLCYPERTPSFVPDGGGMFCGSKATPPRGDCSPSDGSGGNSTCRCNPRFSGQYCDEYDDGNELAVSVQLALGIAGGCLSIIVSCYAVRKAAVSRLRNRHRPSCNGGAAHGVFDCRDRITVAFLCGTFADDAKELLDPLLDPPATSGDPRSASASTQRRDEHASEQSRDEYGSAQSHASGMRCVMGEGTGEG
jgi:hypothetical protein